MLLHGLLRFFCASNKCACTCIWLFQACNPLLYKPKSEVADTIEADFSTQKSYKIPSEADFLIVWSLVPGMNIHSLTLHFCNIYCVKFYFKYISEIHSLFSANYISYLSWLRIKLELSLYNIFAQVLYRGHLGRKVQCLWSICVSDLTSTETRRSTTS